MNRATSRRAWSLVAKCFRDSSSCSSVELNDSAAALSSAEPTRPIDWVTRNDAQARAKRSPTYSPPLSVWKITPATSPPRTAAAMHSAAFATAESWCSLIAKPGRRRDPRSSTVAR